MIDRQTNRHMGTPVYRIILQSMEYGHLYHSYAVSVAIKMTILAMFPTKRYTDISQFLFLDPILIV